VDREIMTTRCEIHAEKIDTLCRKNVEFRKDKFSGTYIDHWALLDSWVILTTCRNKFETDITKFEIYVFSVWKECPLRGYDAVWPGINLLTCRKNLLYPYCTPENLVNFYHTARLHVTADFNINELLIVFIWFVVNVHILFSCW
jgi:hypothetical protein